MRMLSQRFVEQWRGRIVNIHPSLLPKYPGLDTHARALAAGDSTSGCSVHIVTEEVDAGPVIARPKCRSSPATRRVAEQRVLRRACALSAERCSEFVSR